jgi:hypothetical protein
MKFDDGPCKFEFGVLCGLFSEFLFFFFFAAGIHASILYAIAFSMHTPGPVIHNWNILLDGEIQIEMIYRVLPS